LAALDALTHKLVTVTTEGSVTAATVCDLLDKIADLKCPLPITLFLDNARYQHCQQVRDHAAALKIELLFLPAYSPHLNLIERFWRWVKKQCLYNKHYPTFQEFKTAILEFIETAPTKHKQSLSSLLTLKFQSLRKVNIAIS
jgi:transposase